jgi:shikimate dehydrogenase
LKKYGLIGYPLTHSFSRNYFTEKFNRELIRDACFELYPIKNISDIVPLIRSTPELTGLSVTIPYKQKVIPYLNETDLTAQETGAVNCIKITTNKDSQIKLKGFNTDIDGFEQALIPLLKPSHKSALVLGNGGSAKAVIYVLKKLQIPFIIVTRKVEATDQISYKEVTESVIKNNFLIINTTPLGMFPDINTFPDLPYHFITEDHLLFDLVYNPEETVFLKKGRTYGASVQNGLSMLYLQAESSWKIWNDSNL